MATRHNLKAIAAFRGLRGLTIGSAAIAVSGETDHSLGLKTDEWLSELGTDLIQPVIVLMSRLQDEPSSHLVASLVSICLVWASLLFVQAYGLWRNKNWAIWLALITSVFVLSGFAWIALPLFGGKATFIVAGNILVALYLIFLLRRKRRLSE